MSEPLFQIKVTGATTIELSRPPSARANNPELAGNIAHFTLDRTYGGLLWFGLAGHDANPFDYRSSLCERFIAFRLSTFGHDVSPLPGAKTGQVVLQDHLRMVPILANCVQAGRDTTASLRLDHILTREEELYLDANRTSDGGARMKAELLVRAQIAGVEVRPIHERADMWSPTVLTGFAIRLLNSSTALVVPARNGLPHLSAEDALAITEDLKSLG